VLTYKIPGSQCCEAAIHLPAGKTGKLEASDWSGRAMAGFIEDPFLNGSNPTPLRRIGQPKIAGMVDAKPVAALLQNRRGLAQT